MDAKVNTHSYNNIYIGRHSCLPFKLDLTEDRDPNGGISRNAINKVENKLCNLIRLEKRYMSEAS